MKSLFSVLLLSICTVVHAQSTVETTATKKRIIASANYSNTVMVDSNRHYYTGTIRGSVHTDERSYYDLYMDTDLTEQNIFCDSTVHHELFPGMGLIRFSNKAYKYNSSNLATQFAITHMGGYRKYCRFTYNTFGNATSIDTRDSNTGSIVYGHYVRTLVYNTAQQLIMDSNYSIKDTLPFQKRTYRYDANGNDTLCNIYFYDSIAWAHKSIIRKTFDSRNRLIRRLSTYEVLGTFMNVQLDSFGYRGTDTFFNKHTTYSWDNNLSTWTPSEKISLIFSSTKLTDTVILQRGQMLDTFNQKIRYYDAPGGLITAMKAYRYQGAGDYELFPMTENYFYFETYGTSSVEAVNTTTISIAPNPSAGSISINAGNMQFTGITITNIMGQQVYKLSLPATNTATIHTDLAAGNYILNLQTKEGAITTPKKLVIQ